MPVAPAASCALCIGRTHTSNNEYTGTPGIPARNGFNGLCRALPGDRALLPPSPRGYRFVIARLGRQNSAKLDASVGASGPHDFAVRSNISRQRAVDRSQISRSALRSHRAPNAAASTAFHPAFLTIMIRPSCGVGRREFVEMICPTGEVKYFCKRDSTPLSTSRPTGKSLDCSESEFRSCPGRGAAFFTLLRRVFGYI